MKISRLLGAWLAFLLVPATSIAITYTWDGGDVNDNNISSGDNWVGNPATVVSDLSTTGLIFAGSTRLMPNVSAVFSTNSIVFNNTAGAFTIGGSTLNVGASGISNSDSQTMTFSNAVNFSGVATSSITAGSGGLTFQSTVTLPSTSLAISGSNATSFANISGAGALTKTGVGAMNWAPTVSSSLDLTISNGTVTMVADGSTDVLNSTSVIALNGTGIFNINESLTLDGADLTRTSGAAINLAAGKTLTVQNNGDVTITGAFENATASSINVTGLNTTFTTTSTLSFNGGSSLNVTDRGVVNSNGTAINVGTNGAGTVTVANDGATLAGGDLHAGGNGGNGNLTFSDNSDGTFANINVASLGMDAGTIGTLSIQSSAVVTGTGLNLATTTVASTGTVTISGGALTLSGAASATIGANSGSVAALQLTGGFFNSGTGTTLVRPTGSISINSGGYNAHGNVTLDGGQLTRAAGNFNLDAGRTFTVQAGADAVFTGAYTNSTASTILVTGSGSTFSTTGVLTLQSGSTLNIAAGGSVSTGGANIALGSFNTTNTVSVDGAGSSLSGGLVALGNGGSTASMTFSNGATGTFGVTNVPGNNIAGNNGTLSVQSGASATLATLAVGQNQFAYSGAVTIAGASSTLNVDGALTLGAAGASTASVTVQSGGTFRTGTNANVNATGVLNVNAGGTLTGAADFGGTGQVNLAGILLPGTPSGANRTTSLSFAQNITLQGTTSITMELAGLTAGTDYDQIVFNGAGNPHITWNGTLNVLLILGFTPQPGNTFDLFNFDAARDAGTFSTINLPALSAGLFWRTGQLYATGVIHVSSVPDTYAEWETAFGVTGGFDGDDDHDGVRNGIEFLLGTNPQTPGAAPLTELLPVTSGANKNVGVTFVIPEHPSAEAHYRVGASSDSMNWTTIASKDGAGPWSGPAAVTIDPPSAGTTRIVVTETLPLSTARRFHRLEGEEP